jgi:hypothetical protein
MVQRLQLLQRYHSIGINWAAIVPGELFIIDQPLHSFQSNRRQRLNDNGMLAHGRAPGSRCRTDGIRSSNLVPECFKLLTDHLPP